MRQNRIIGISIVIIALASLWPSIAKSQPINDLQKDNFRREIEKLMKTYGDMASFTSEQANFDMGMATNFRGTFIESQKKIIFNDLLPLKVDGEKYLAPITYTQFAQRYYPDGLDIRFTVDNISFEEIAVKGVYTAIVKATKTVRGFYDGKRIHNFSGPLFFYVQAHFTDTRVDKIGISMVADPEKFAQLQSNKNLGGLYAGVGGIYGQSLLFNPTIFTNTTWQTTMGKGFSPSIEVYYMITKGFGIGTGLRLGSYSTTLTLTDYSEQLSSTVTDMDGDEYNPIFEIPELEELNMIKTIDIPFSLKFRGGKGNTGFYFDIGVVYSTFKEATYTLNGSATTKGYYPEFHVILENIPEYNFETTQFNSQSSTLEMPANNLAASVSMGLSFVLIPNLALKIGANAIYGLTDLMYYDPRYPMDFYATTGLDGDKTNILSAGVEFGLSYRILGGGK